MKSYIFYLFFSFKILHFWNNFLNYFSKDTKLKMAKELHNIDFLNNEPYEVAQKITQPIFVIHGTKDIHVQFENSEKLMENVQSKEKKFIPFDGNHCSFNRYDYVLQQLIFILNHNGIDITEFKKEKKGEYLSPPILIDPGGDKYFFFFFFF